MLRSSFDFNETLTDDEYSKLTEEAVNNESSLMVPRKILPNEQLITILRRIYDDSETYSDSDLIYNYIINNDNIQDKFWDDVYKHITDNKEKILNEYLKLNDSFLTIFNQNLVKDYVNKYDKNPPDNYGFQRNIHEIFDNNEDLKNFFYYYYNISGLFSDFIYNILSDNIVFSNADMSFIFCLMCVRSKFSDDIY